MQKNMQENMQEKNMKEKNMQKNMQEKNMQKSVTWGLWLYQHNMD